MQFGGGVMHARELFPGLLRWRMLRTIAYVGLVLASFGSVYAKKAATDWVRLSAPDRPDSRGLEVLISREGGALCLARGRHSFRELRGTKLAKVEALVEQISALVPAAPPDAGPSTTITIKSDQDGSMSMLAYDDQTEVGRQLLALERELLKTACRRRVRP